MPPWMPISRCSRLGLTIMNIHTYCHCKPISSQSFWATAMRDISFNLQIKDLEIGCFHCKFLFYFNIVLKIFWKKAGKHSIGWGEKSKIFLKMPTPTKIRILRNSMDQ
jgi:hypothetical protein